MSASLKGLGTWDSKKYCIEILVEVFEGLSNKSFEVKLEKAMWSSGISAAKRV